MKQPKWIESVEAIDHWEPGYWVARSWDREARMKATSVIDAVATNMMIAEPTREMRVPIGGIAHAGHPRHIESRVPCGQWKMDAGGTAHALIRPDLGDVAIRLAHAKGQAHLRGALYRGDVTPQIAQEAPPDPSGATGLDTRSVMLRTARIMGVNISRQVVLRVVSTAACRDCHTEQTSGHGTAGSRPCIGLPLRTSMPDGNT